MLYPGFSWTPSTSSIESATSSVPQSEISVSNVSAAKFGTLVVSGVAWQALVDDVDQSSTAGTDAFQNYYTDLENNYAIASGNGYNAETTDSGGVYLAGYQFLPLQADGPFGGEDGFLLESGSYAVANPADYAKDTLRELTISYSSANADGSRCFSSCAYTKYWIFLSDPMTVGNILQETSWENFDASSSTN